jgi:Rrf2 family protein
MKLQKNTSLALYSVLESAADPDRHVAAGTIAEKYGVSAHHLAKVLSDLARAGVLASVRGVGGGYRFTANARRLTLLDVIQRFEALGPSAGGLGDGERTPAGRALHTILSEIDEMAKATFSSITIETMLRLIARQQRVPVRREHDEEAPRTQAKRKARKARSPLAE